ncbi:MAG: S8 family serine peptidase, partial [Candidatus Marinimicrobia bacterium]|nr:S8 family serine peptidase [Candidatus Neomarinimicrobiota bacterium]
AEAGWDINTGDTDIVLAIIDTVVDWEHEDLQAKIWQNEDEVLNGFDSDGNGKIDDIRGWDFVHVQSWMTPAHASEDGKDPDNNPMDVDGHGTHCAGIAGGATNNGVGVAAINWGVKIMPVRVGYHTEEGEGSIPFGYQGIVYAADNGADILSLSWGGSGFQQAGQDFINYAWEKGCVIIAAAGNENTDEHLFPAAYNHVLSVAATGNTSDQKAWFSNFGDWVDVCAPGSYINATIPNNSYVHKSGTSMACPMVAGAAGLVMSQFPSFNNHDIVTQIAMTCDDIYDVNPGFQGQLGYGRINLEVMLQAAEWRPNLKLSNVYIDDSDGNNNGFADPGEIIKLILDIENAFIGGDISGLTMTLSSMDSDINLNINSSNIDYISALQTVSNSTSPFKFTVASNAVSHRAS